jgi:hypothetical protein
MPRVDEAAEQVPAADRGDWRAGHCWRWLPWFWGCESERAVRAMAVVMVDELAENALEVPAVHDQDPVQALSPIGAYEPLGDRVRRRRPDGGVDDPDTLGVEYRVEGARELAVVVAD